MQLLILSSLILSAPAGEPPAQAKATVDRVLVAPLAQAEERRSRFSRARIAPVVRSVRVTETVAQKDKGGAAFFAFAIDESRGFARKVTSADLTGCVYPESGEVFVKRGEVYYPAAFLLGKTRDKAAEHVCKAT